MNYFELSEFRSSMAPEDFWNPEKGYINCAENPR